MKIFEYVLDWIFPPSCEICGKSENSYMCGKCGKKLEKFIYYENNKNGKYNKRKEFYHTKEKFHLFRYEGIIREKMIAYKFNDKPYIYQVFTELIKRNDKACEFLNQYDVIIPVPIHSKRKRTRGYNQSELIAKAIARALNKEIIIDALVKRKNTKPQSTLGKLDREKNVQGVFEIRNAKKIEKKRVVIFDDIYTTGATTNACKKILEEAGAEKVGIFTIAKD